MSGLTSRIDCRMSLQVPYWWQEQRKTWLSYSVPSMFQWTTTWMNTTGHCCWMRKIRKFLLLLRTVVTPGRSVRASRKAPLINQFPSTIFLNLFANGPFRRWQIRRFSASIRRSDFTKIPYQEEMHRFFVRLKGDIADRRLCILATCNSDSKDRLHWRLICWVYRKLLKYVVSMTFRLCWPLYV